MTLKQFSPLAVLLLLSGCATVQHECRLGEECVGTTDVYQAAVANQGNSESVMADAAMRVAGAQQEIVEQWRPYDGGGLTDQPVYRPGKPVRIWVAPWRGSDGILRSGEYLYVTLPDEWSYGELRADGIGAGMIGPSFGGQEVRPAPQYQPNANRVQPRMRMIPEE